MLRWGSLCHKATLRHLGCSCCPLLPAPLLPGAVPTVRPRMAVLRWQLQSYLCLAEQPKLQKILWRAEGNKNSIIKGQAQSRNKIKNMEVFKNRRGKLDQECQRYGLPKERGASSPAVRKAVIQLCGFFCSRSHGGQGAAFGLQLLQCHTWDAAAASVQRPLGLTWPRTLSVTGDPTFALQLLGAAEISPQFPKLRQEELT